MLDAQIPGELAVLPALFELLRVAGAQLPEGIATENLQGTGFREIYPLMDAEQVLVVGRFDGAEFGAPQAEVVFFELDTELVLHRIEGQRDAEFAGERMGKGQIGRKHGLVYVESDSCQRPDNLSRLQGIFEQDASQFAAFEQDVVGPFDAQEAARTEGFDDIEHSKGDGFIEQKLLVDGEETGMQHVGAEDVGAGLRMPRTKALPTAGRLAFGGNEGAFGYAMLAYELRGIVVG